MRFEATDVSLHVQKNYFINYLYIEELLITRNPVEQYIGLLYNLPDEETPLKCIDNTYRLTPDCINIANYTRVEQG